MHISYEIVDEEEEDATGGRNIKKRQQDWGHNDSEEEFFTADEISSLGSKLDSIDPIKILGEKHVTNNATITAVENMPLLMTRAHHSML